MTFLNSIQGSSFADQRGELNFFNDFDLSEIVRMYEIMPNDILTIRGWQAHKNEKKWFYCNVGAFTVNIVKIDNFEKPSKKIIPEQFVLEAKKPTILEISGGYATGFRARQENSKLIVFSNFSLKDSKDDDFRFSLDTWSADW